GGPGEQRLLALVTAVAEPEVLLDHVRGDPHAVLAGRDDVALARHHVAGAEDRLVAAETTEVGIGPAVEVAILLDALHRLGHAADGTHHERGAELLDRAVDRHRLAALDARALQAQPDQVIAVAEQPDRHPLGAHVEAVLLHRLLEDAPARGLELVAAGNR